MKIEAGLQKRFGILLSLLLVAAPVVATSSPHIGLRDDAYHFPSFDDGQHDVNFVEWWYFNFYDEEQDVQIAVTYSVLDPERLSILGRAGLGAIVYTSDDSFNLVQFFPTESFHASTERADVTIADEPQNTIEIIDEDTYHIVGNIEGEHQLSWDLTYLQQSRPFFGGRRENVGRFPWEQMSWLVYMPVALVSGEVVIDGRTYFLNDVPGYHDHNWGEFLLTTFTWNWAQYSEPGLTLMLGDFIRKEVGDVSVDFQGRRTVFKKEEYRLIHTRWTVDPEYNLRIPARTWLYAENNKRRLLARLDTLETVPVPPPADIPFLLKKPIIYEQTAHYLGGLWEKNQRGEWSLAIVFDGSGFKEYTAQKWLIGER